jgi:ABC-2 type transport system ATP-binding protein
MSGLDPFGRSDIFELIQTLKKQGKTILFCSHILEDVDRLVDKVLVLHEGRNLFDGNLADLIAGQKSDSFVDSFKSIVETKKHETEH